MTPADTVRHVPVVVVGGGQAGLSISWYLTRDGIEHLVLERDEIAHDWQDARWDSFCLVTPNWQCRLPGFPYDGDDPDGFMLKDEIVDYLRRYAASFGPPVREHTEVLAVRPTPDGGFEVETSSGRLGADVVVVATGGYHRPYVPRFADRLPARLVQLHSVAYRRPEQLPDGDVLVVGTGQSGAQIAEDLHLAGRRVHLSVSTAPRVARFYRGRDCVAWLEEMGHYRITVAEHPLHDDVRHRTNHYVTGRDGGRDIDLRAFARDGMRLYGTMQDVVLEGPGSDPDGPDGPGGGTPGPDAGQRVVLRFASDLAKNLDAADGVSESIKDAIDRWIADHGIDAPGEGRYTPVWTPGRESEEVPLEETSLTAVVWCTGFLPDYRWVHAGVFDGRGLPVHQRGVSDVAGLYFLGLPWQHTWGSGRFSGVGEDAEHLADQIRARLGQLGRASTGGSGTAGGRAADGSAPLNEWGTGPAVTD